MHRTHSLRLIGTLAAVCGQLLAGCAQSSARLETGTVADKPVENAQAVRCTPQQNASSATIALCSEIAAAAGGVAATQVGAGNAQTAADVIIEFDADESPVSTKDRKSLALAIEANAKAGRTMAVIYAARGGDGNIFERAALAERRANVVKQLLPPRVVRSIEFDPQQADDTIRVQFTTSPDSIKFARFR